MTKQGDHLHVTYRFENHTDHVVYVNDGAVQQISNTRWVKNTRNNHVEPLDARTVVITVGTPGDVPAVVGVPGFYVPVAKGAAFEGARDVALPFAGTDALTRAAKRGDWFTKASFRLYASDGEPARWRELPTDAGPVRVPDGPPLRFLTGAVQPLPQ